MSFVSPVLPSVLYELQNAFSISGVARNDSFEKILKTVAQNFKYDVYIISVQILFPLRCYSNL